MQDLDDKSDIPTDEELLLFSETESEMEEAELKKHKNHFLYAPSVKKKT
jgi:hypothetical protein